MSPEGTLKGVEGIPFGGQALDGIDAAPVGLDGEHQASADCLAVNQDRAGTANTVLATNMGTSLFKVATQEVGKVRPLGNLGLNRHSI